MAGCIVKKEEALSPSFGETFEYVNCLIDLSEKVVRIKPPIAVFSSLEDNPGLPGECEDILAERVKGREGVLRADFA